MPSPLPFSPPAGYTDYFLLEMQINYNNSLVNSLEGLGYATTPSQESQAGWTESYLLTGAVSGAVPTTAAYAILAARAACFGVNFYIKKALVHWNSVFKSSFPLPNSATKGLWDSLSIGTSTASISNQFCNSPEATIMLRGECADFRRYEHSLRGIKDYMANDTVNYLSPSSYAVPAVQPYTNMFDTAQAALPMPNSTGGVASTWTVTNTNGVISTPVLVGGGNYPGVAAGTYPCFYISPAGQATQAFGTITINGAGAATAATIYSGYGGSGYAGTNVSIGVSNDPFGLPNYQTPTAYWANFMSCLLQYTGSAMVRRVSQKTYTGSGQPSFPSGMVPVIVGTQLDPATRFMFQRLGNRQTGQIRLTKPARVKRGI